MQEMTKDYVRQTLAQEHLWKTGESDTFTYELSQPWEFTLRREEDRYLPYRYALEGRKTGTLETHGRRYPTMQDAFLHIVNRLNENATVKNRYTDIRQWLDSR